MDDATQTRTVVVMGVSGTGKTTIGKELARREGWVFAEGDEFHSPENVAKMSAGIPLDDDDRWPWLRSIAAWIDEREAAGQNAVVTCSALKRAYRDLLREGNPSVWFAHLVASDEVLRKRIQGRRGHHMPVSLLTSQLQTLEPLVEGEPGVQVYGQGPVEEVVRGIQDTLPPLAPREGGGPDAPSEGAS